MTATADHGRAVRGIGVRQIPLLVWLVLVWVLLWGDFTWANLLGGLAVALVLSWALPLPPVAEHPRVRPVAFLRLVVLFTWDLIRSSVQVAWEALRPGGGRRSALIAVQLRTDSDLLLTLVAEALTLTPGSIVLDLDRRHQVLAVHVMPVRDAEHLEQRRRDVLLMEERVVRALGGRQDIEALDRALDAGGAGVDGRPAGTATTQDGAPR